MGRVGEIEAEGGGCDAAAAADDDTVFVAVGRNVEECKATLRWAVRNFSGMRICLLHVHQPMKNTELAANKPKQCAVHDLHEVEMQKMPEVLNEYLVFLAQAGVVDSDKVWIETDSIEKGILESISQYNIRWLVMGAAADKDNSKLDSRKAVFVCQNAPDFSQIWFICNGCLIYTKQPECLKSERPTFKQKSLDRLMNPECRIIQRSRYGEFSIEQLVRSSSRLKLSDGYIDKSEDDRGPPLRRLRSQCLEHPASTSKSSLLGCENKKIQGQPAGDLYFRLEQAIMDGKSSRRQEFEEAVRRWKEEDNALDAKMKARSVEILYNKEVNVRAELEKMLGSKRQESDMVKNQYHETTRELLTVQEQNSILEKQVQESKLVVKELEEKIVSAVELLITFKERRDKLRVEHQDALKHVRDLRRSVLVGTSSLCGPQILSFSFAEIIEATHNFDPSQRIGEGKYGTVYKGLLRHLHVAIRMLPSFGSPGTVDFEHGVEVLSRVRHPNLVTLIGTCPESQSLVYEYLKAGSLEERLSRKGKTAPLPWNIRTQIATDICSVLVYLHSHKPPIIHGNLKPSKVLLNANFVAKVGDLGIYCLVPKYENSKITKSDAESDSEVNSPYEDPEFLVSGQLTPESDVYSFGIILLQLVTGRSALSIVKDVKCALDNGNFDKVVDFSAGDWPLDQAKWLAELGLRCCEQNKLDRPDLVSEISSVIESIRALSIESASTSRSKEPGKTPSHFVCPILQEVMKDPLIAADGFTYEAEAIQGWLHSGHNTSPMTNLELEHNNLVRNHALLYAIQEWQELL
ncbi:U-box domain-containing protein 32 isoform X2 [Syzygium oleosum]|uniref:U-box domain-containing protein 32 isoform X2 n=1 Tax=Syzygium oleosum TaxID=219896 RepID=UPI0024B8FE82|nr:U-box domain-containing protein 32 isoform X2 [Syzygium oleosum]